MNEPIRTELRSKQSGDTLNRTLFGNMLVLAGARARFRGRLISGIGFTILFSVVIGIAGCTGMATKPLTPESTAALQITAGILPAGTVQSTYTTTLTATGGAPPYAWSSTSGQLPAGLALNPITGTIAGTPTSAGTFSFVTTVRDSKTTQASAGLSMVVSAKTSSANDASTLQITTSALPVGAVQSGYATNLTATGGAPPYAWSITGGLLPSGLKIGATTGAISGTPTLAGSYSITAAVKDSKAASDTAAFSLNISTMPGPAISTVSPTRGSSEAETPVVISGNNFRSGVMVQFGKFAASQVQVTSPTQLHLMAPAAPSGSVNVIVQNSDGQIATAGTPFTFAAPATPAATGPTEQALSADAFVDSAGVNVHLHNGSSPYANFAAVEKALKALGVRHIRDGLIDTAWTPYYDRLNELGRSGIKALLISSPTESGALLAAYPGRVTDSFEAYEGPNEYDLSGDPNWATTLNTFLAKLHSAVKADAKASKFPIVGPALTQGSSYPRVASSAGAFDDANLHNYFGGHNPGTGGWGGGGYGSIAWNLANANGAWPGKPVITTETGYMTNLSKQDAVPEDVAGKYFPRVFLEQWMHGIKRTYIYELVDEVGKDSDEFGMLRSDFSAKPGFNAVKNMLGLLSDPGPAFQAGGLNFKLSGNLTNVQHLLLEKRDGTFYLAVWVEQPGYDVNTKKELGVAAQQVTVQTGQQMRTNVHRIDASGNMQTSTLGVGQTQTIEVSDLVTILEISQ
jgi:hypothetical protein